MNPEIDKLIAEQFNKLPENLRLAIKSVPWKALVQDVGKANALTIEQIALLEQETMFVIYGFENPRDFVENIIKEVGVEEELAITLAEDVSIKVLREIESKVKTAGDGSKSNLPEIPPEDLPAVVPGEKVHDTVKQVDSRQQIVDRKEGRVPVNLQTDGNVPMLEEHREEVRSREYGVGKEEGPREKTRPGGDDAVTTTSEVGSEEKEVGGVQTPTNSAYAGQDPYREPIE